MRVLHTLRTLLLISSFKGMATGSRSEPYSYHSSPSTEYLAGSFEAVVLLPYTLVCSVRKYQQHVTTMVPDN